MALKYQFPFSNPDTADGFGSLIGRSTPHRGLDFAQPRYTGIPSAAAGVIKLKHYTPALGYITVVGHPDGKFTGYCHSDQASSLAVGAPVSRGQIINSVGNTGYSTGPHLHLTVSDSVTGVFEGQVEDPYLFIHYRLNGDDPSTTPPITPQPGEDMPTFKSSTRATVQPVGVATPTDEAWPMLKYREDSSQNPPLIADTNVIEAVATGAYFNAIASVTFTGLNAGSTVRMRFAAWSKVTGAFSGFQSLTVHGRDGGNVEVQYAQNVALDAATHRLVIQAYTATADVKAQNVRTNYLAW